MSYKKNSTTSARVAIYIRVSTLHQIDKDSLPMQRNDLVNYCKFILNTEDYVVFEDAGYSGKNTDRPRYQEMTHQIRQGLFTHLLVWKIDRISRNLLDFASMYSELKKLGVIFVSKNEQFDTSTAMGEAMLKIILVFAELERNMTSERVTATMISRANGGLWNGGRVPFGYNYEPSTRTFSINDKEACVVKLIHSKYLELSSLVQLSNYLNDNGYTTRNGNLWSAVTLQIILRNLFYCGEYQYNKNKDGNRQQPKDPSEWIRIPDHHAAIIDYETKSKVINMLNSNQRLHLKTGIKKTKNVHIFSGILICESCGSYLSSTIEPSSRGNYSRYSCPVKRKSKLLCSQPSISDKYLGEFVFNLILNIINIQRDYKSSWSSAELERKLLIGNVFSTICSVDINSMNDLVSALTSSSSNVIYNEIRLNKSDNSSALSSLRAELTKAQRALSRLTDLYLYSEDTMSEAEFVSRKGNIVEQIDNINEQIGFLSADSWEQQLSDEQFINMASKFIITEKLTDRNYICYKNLSSTVDANILREFVLSVIDNMHISGGNVASITFKNGLYFKFVYKNIDQSK